MRRPIIAATAALALAFASIVLAQSTTQDRPKNMDQLKGEQTQAVTVEGCLLQEKDVPGRQPNVAERAAKPTGLFEDYILVKASFLKGAPEGYVGTTGAEKAEKGEASETAMGQMFEVRGIDAAQLKDLVGKRVQIEGRIDPKDLTERSRTQAKEGGAGDLPELHGTAVKQVPGECKVPVK